MKNSVTIIGGSWGKTNDEIKESSIIKKLAEAFSGKAEVYNGGYLNALPQLKSDLNIWMPDIHNSAIKEYPMKPKGSCLIVSKVIRDVEGEHPYFQPLTRIFRMQGNAVIAIDKVLSVYHFTLIDALGNIWVKTHDVSKLVAAILKFYSWSKQQKRASVALLSENSLPDVLMSDGDLSRFLTVVRENAANIVTGTKDRFFGNCSTRCMALFPSVRANSTDRLYSECFLVSARNSSKKGIQPEDMVTVNGDLGFFGNKKPSVDTPVQVALYKHYYRIKYMIHGHAFFNDALTTLDYFPCGDLREVEEIKKLFSQDQPFFAVNLKNHGFLIGASTVEEIDTFLKNNVPVMRPFGHIER